VPARDPSFCVPGLADAGVSVEPAPMAAVDGALLVAEPTAGRGGVEGDPLEEVPEPPVLNPPRVADVPLPEALPHLHERIRAVLRRHEAI